MPVIERKKRGGGERKGNGGGGNGSTQPERWIMEYRQLGSSGLRVPALSFGTGTFGGQGPLFSAWGTSDATEGAAPDRHQPRRRSDPVRHRRRLFERRGGRDIGRGDQGRRDAVLISTKTGLPMGDGPQDWGASRSRLIRAVEDALRRLGTDHIDLLQLHAFDASTPVDELMDTLATLIAAGKLRYAGVSNYPGWQLMKAQAAADRLGTPRFVAHQVYYSLIGRAYEADLMPLAADQGVGALVWSPLGWGRLTGKIGRERTGARGQPSPRNRATSRRRLPKNCSTASSTRSKPSPPRPARRCRRSRSTGCSSAPPCRR